MSRRKGDRYQGFLGDEDEDKDKYDNDWTTPIIAGTICCCIAFLVGLVGLILGIYSSFFLGHSHRCDTEIWGDMRIAYADSPQLLYLANANERLQVNFTNLTSEGGRGVTFVDGTLKVLTSGRYYYGIYMTIESALSLLGEALPETISIEGTGSQTETGVQVPYDWESFIAFFATGPYIIPFKLHLTVNGQVVLNEGFAQDTSNDFFFGNALKILDETYDPTLFMAPPFNASMSWGSTIQLNANDKVGMMVEISELCSDDFIANNCSTLYYYILNNTYAAQVYSFVWSAGLSVHKVGC